MIHRTPAQAPSVHSRHTRQAAEGCRTAYQEAAACRGDPACQVVAEGPAEGLPVVQEASWVCPSEAWEAAHMVRGLQWAPGCPAPHHDLVSTFLCYCCPQNNSHSDVAAAAHESAAVCFMALPGSIATDQPCLSVGSGTQGTMQVENTLQCMLGCRCSSMLVIAGWNWSFSQSADT